MTDSSRHLPYPQDKYGDTLATTSFSSSTTLLHAAPQLADDGDPGHSGHAKQEHTPPQQGVALKFYSQSTVILALWIAYTATMMWLFEHTVTIGRTIVVKPWHYDVLPGLLFTLFSQAHLGVTAMHLSRLALSSLHKPLLAPRTWVEVFWSASGNWQGPVGVGMTLMGMIQMRVGISLSFVLFALCSLPAWVVPLVLERAYPVEAVDIPQDIMFRPNVTASTGWAGVDLYGQLGLGGGMWSSGVDIFSMYNATTYVLPGSSRVAGVEDLFLSGDIKGKDATLPGIRINGSCSVDTDDHQAAMNESFTRFTDRCTSQKWTLVDQSGKPFSASFFDGAGHYASCIPANSSSSLPPWYSGQPPSPSLSEALAWFSMRNTSNVDRNPAFIQGVIKCAWTMNTGVAALNGRAGTFSSYKDGWNFSGIGAEGPTHPLQAALTALGDLSTSSTDSAFGSIAPYIQDNGWMLRVGVKKVSGGQSADTRFTLPALEEIANRMSTGVAYMANAMSVLSSNDESEYQAKEYVTSTARVRVPSFAWASYALLGIWLFVIIILTALLYRPTFGSGLDSYTVGRLLMDEPQLVRGKCCGELEDNAAMKAKFYPVGDSYAERDVGHIIAGGKGPLVKGRAYS